MIALTGATGQLGQLVVKHLLTRVAPSTVVAVVRDAAKAKDLAAAGIQVRVAAYGDETALTKAFAGVSSVLLISSSEVGQRVPQHLSVVEAAKAAGVGRFIYTSVLKADRSPLSLAPEHMATETAVRASGLPFVILRNGWYTENYTAGLGAALAHGVLLGSAGDGRLSLAPRDDYALAAAIVLAGGGETGRVYELAGDTACTLTEFAAELSRQAGRTIPYQNLPEAEYSGILVGAGLPGWLASGLASWDVAASKGALYDASGDLSRLIGRPTTPLATVMAAALPRA